MPIKKIFEAVPTHLIVVNKYTKGISLNRPGNMFFRLLKFRAGAHKFNFDAAQIAVQQWFLPHE